jgi:hypothetical protein
MHRKYISVGFQTLDYNTHLAILDEYRGYDVIWITDAIQGGYVAFV